MDLKLTGFAELKETLTTLEPRLRKKIVGKSVRAGAKVVQKAARANAPKRINSWPGMKFEFSPGNLKRGIIIRRVKRQPRFIVRDRLGFSGKAWYGFLVERGHKYVVGGTLSGGKKRRSFKGKPFDRKGRKTTSGQGRVVGHVAAKPFLRPAFDNNQEAIFAEMYRVLVKELDKLK